MTPLSEFDAVFIWVHRHALEANRRRAKLLHQFLHNTWRKAPFLAGQQTRYQHQAAKLHLFLEDLFERVVIKLLDFIEVRQLNTDTKGFHGPHGVI